MSSVRKEIMAHLTSIAAEAIQAGGNGHAALMFRFPGIPSEVAAAADIEAHAAETDRWWQSVERTIDAEVINKALSAK